MPSNGEKIMFFVIPEMPSKTFVIVFKKLPDHFKGWMVDSKSSVSVGSDPDPSNVSPDPQLWMCEN